MVSVADSASRRAISRPASDMPLRRNVSAAVLYSWRRLSCGSTPSRSRASRTKTARATTPVRPRSPLGCSQISSNAVARWYPTLPALSSPNVSVQDTASFPDLRKRSTASRSSLECARLIGRCPMCATRPATRSSPSARLSASSSERRTGTCLRAQRAAAWPEASRPPRGTGRARAAAVRRAGEATAVEDSWPACSRYENAQPSPSRNDLRIRRATTMRCTSSGPS